MDAPDDVLDSLGIKLLPVGKPRHTLEFRDMAFQSVITDVAFEPHVLMRFAGNTAALLFFYYRDAQRGGIAEAQSRRRNTEVGG